jgi:uncharacterized protein with PIN domain
MTPSIPDGPSKLNLGDCFAYVLAKHSGESLLFKATSLGTRTLPRQFSAR